MIPKEHLLTASGCRFASSPAVFLELLGSEPAQPEPKDAKQTEDEHPPAEQNCE